MVRGEMGWLGLGGGKAGVDMSWRSAPALCPGVYHSVDAHRGGHETVKLYFICAVVESREVLRAF